MEYFAKRLSELMDKRNMSDDELADKLNVSRTTILRWRKGERSPKMSKIPDIAKEFGVHPTYFIDDDNIKPVAEKPMRYSIPIYGVIPAGSPALAEENIIGDLSVPSQLINKYGINNLISLKISGDSMNKVIPNGFIAVLHQTENISNGDIVGVLINGYDCTLKRIYKTNNRVILEPDSYNSEFKPYIFECTDIFDCPEIKIIGKYVWGCAPID